MKLQRIDNPPNPFDSQHREWLGPPPDAQIEVYEEESSTILSKNDSPDLPFTWSVNPYRGCQHACAYCYARPYHEYLGYGAGTDFDTKLIVKTNAADLLRKAFKKKDWKFEMINFSGITDCYQPLEAVYGITRRCLEICLAYGNPVSIVTKSFLVVRDADLLVKLNHKANVFVYISIPFADGKTAGLIEPQAPPPKRRYEAIRQLHEAGVPVGVFVSPVIPGLTDKDIPKILKESADAGAQSAAMTALRLPGSVETVFLGRLKELMPRRAKRIIHRIQDIRGGSMSDSRFGRRMKGDGAYWESIRNLFDISCRQYGLNGSSASLMQSLPKTKPVRRRESQMAFDFGS